MKKKENILLTFLLVTALITIILIKFIFVEIPEKLIYGAELGEIIYNFSLAYISSYLFYQIVVVIPKNRDLKNIYSIAKSISFGIIYRGSRIIKPEHNSDEYFDLTDIKSDISQEEFKNICNSININDTFDFSWVENHISQISYLKHFKKTKIEITKQADELFKFISHLETEHIKLVKDILDCPFMAHGDIYLDNEDMRTKKETFGFMFPMLFDFYTKVRKLNKYMNQIKL